MNCTLPKKDLFSSGVNDKMLNVELYGDDKVVAPKTVRTVTLRSGPTSTSTQEFLSKINQPSYPFPMAPTYNQISASNNVSVSSEVELKPSIRTEREKWLVEEADVQCLTEDQLFQREKLIHRNRVLLKQQSLQIPLVLPPSASIVVPTRSLFPSPLTPFPSAPASSHISSSATTPFPSTSSTTPFPSAPTTSRLASVPPLSQHANTQRRRSRSPSSKSRKISRSPTRSKSRGRDSRSSKQRVSSSYRSSRDRSSRDRSSRDRSRTPPRRRQGKKPDASPSRRSVTPPKSQDRKSIGSSVTNYSVNKSSKEEFAKKSDKKSIDKDKASEIMPSLEKVVEIKLRDTIEIIPISPCSPIADNSKKPALVEIKSSVIETPLYWINYLQVI